MKHLNLEKVSYCTQIKPQCPPSIFIRIPACGEKTNCDWLLYSKKIGFIIYGPCFLFKNEDTSFGFRREFSDWKNIRTQVQGHETHLSHKTCVLDFVLCRTRADSIDHNLKEQLEEETKYIGVMC